jgi:Ca2+-dependent lipid-binding protein
LDLYAGLADPYVKGHLGPYRFQTKIHKKTLNPKWLEEFNIPITSWEAVNLLSLQVRDKDPIFDDSLGLVSLLSILFFSLFLSLKIDALTSC